MRGRRLGRRPRLAGALRRCRASRSPVQAPLDASVIYSTFQNIAKRYPPAVRPDRAALPPTGVGLDRLRGTTIEQALAGRPGYRDRPHRTIPLGRGSARPSGPTPRRAAEGPGLARLVRAEGPPVVGYLGRFVPEKGLGLLTRALDAQPAGTWRAL